MIFKNNMLTNIKGILLIALSYIYALGPILFMLFPLVVAFIVDYYYSENYPWIGLRVELILYIVQLPIFALIVYLVNKIDYLVVKNVK